MSRLRFISRKKTDASKESRFPFVRTSGTEKSNRPENNTQSFFSGIHPKLEVSKPGDKSERQADSMANAVVNSSGPVQAKAGDDAPQVMHRAEEDKKQAKLQTQPKKEDDKAAKKDLQMKEEDKMQKKGEEDKVKKKEDDKKMQKKGENEKDKVSKKEEDKKQAKLIQPKAEESGTKSFNNRMESAKSGGFPIPDKVRKDMEARFKIHFGDVKIHTDDDAIALCQEINAQAFTNGYHIFFNSGKFNPETSSGKLLLAHELTHVVQQME
jgi:hypothetical protein